MGENEDEQSPRILAEPVSSASQGCISIQVKIKQVGEWSKWKLEIPKNCDVFLLKLSFNELLNPSCEAS